jgi:hypothetical protein
MLVGKSKPTPFNRQVFVGYAVLYRGSTPLVMLFNSMNSSPRLEDDN